MVCSNKNCWKLYCNDIEDESDGDTYFKQLLLKEYLEKMRKHFVEIIGEGMFSHNIHEKLCHHAILINL